ncbi:hypothetical protein BB560_001085 [Smittium megazygosporum]|uniref:K Homology domain-containing protein n=1 Tax=Smittium megazygosporum TaxID=133381 RepID=A0A2T9ZII8_9FUNG|nr:hypothetical protein BB560_001085 [Smittium megazygosporum]
MWPTALHSDIQPLVSQLLPIPFPNIKHPSSPIHQYAFGCVCLQPNQSPLSIPLLDCLLLGQNYFGYLLGFFSFLIMETELHASEANLAQPSTSSFEDSPSPSVDQSLTLPRTAVIDSSLPNDTQPGSSEPSVAERFAAMSVNETPSAPSNAPKKTSAPNTLDFSSEKAFPSLAPASRAKKSSFSQWGKPSPATGISKSSILGPNNSASKITEIIDLPLGQINPKSRPSKGKDSKKSTFTQKPTVADVVREIMLETNTQIEVSRATQINTMTFIITGNSDNVSQAKREIFSQLSPHVSIVIQIPAVVRRFLIGTKGQTLASIQNQTGARIVLPPKDEAEKNSSNYDKNLAEIDDDDLIELIEVTVNGDVQGTSKRGARLTNIPHEYYTFIAGSNNKNINAWMEEFPGLKVSVPLFFGDSDSSSEGDSKQKNTGIFISGERDAVTEIIKRIESMTDSLRRTIRTIQIELPKRQHRFIIGPGGSVVSDIFDQTGCSVEVPSIKDTSTLITIRGPQAKLMDAMAKVMDQANAYTFDYIDASLIRGSTPNTEYGYDILHYFQTHRLFKQFEQANDVSIFTNLSGSAHISGHKSEQLKVELVGKDESAVKQAINELLSEMRKFEPTMFGKVEVDPSLHGYLVGRNGNNAAKIRSQFGISILTPIEPESLGNLKPAKSSKITLVYEGTYPQIESIKDKKQKTKAILDHIADCKKELEKTVTEATNFGVEIINIPNKYHRSLIGVKGASLRDLFTECGIDENENKIYVDFGNISSDKKDSQGKKASADISSSKSALNENQVSVKGNKKLVALIANALKKKAKELEEYDALHSFYETCQVPFKFLSRIIGKGGSGLSRISSSFDVQIEVLDEKNSTPQGTTDIKIKGTKKGVQDAKNEINRLVEFIADQTVEIIKVDPEYHRSLIGAGGRIIRRLEDRYAISVQFPSNNKSDTNTSNDDANKDSTPSSTTSPSAELSKPSSENRLKEDEILLRGGSKGVASAISELKELIEFEKLNNYSNTIKIPSKHLRYIVGRNGSKIAEIREQSNVRIDISGDRNAATDSLVDVVITGVKANVEKAKAIINDLIDELNLVKEVHLRVDPKHHRFLIGASGSFVRELIKECGGNPELTSGAGSCRIFFPRLNDGEKDADLVRLVGDASVVNKAVEKINDITADRDSMVTVSVAIPSNQHAFIIGRGGSNLRRIQDTHKVQIRFPSPSKNRKGNASEKEHSAQNADNVTITGKPENCEAAQKELISLVQETKDIRVPLVFHNKFGGRESQLWKTLFSLYNVAVDAVKVDKPNTLPKRIDEETDSGNYTLVDISFELNDPNGPTATWQLKGNKKQLDQAEKHINDKKEELKQSCFVLTFEIDTSMIKFVIGKGGSTIEEIRSSSGAQIDIPKQKFNKSSKVAVTVTGDKNSVLAAKTLIDEIIENRD